MCQTIGFLGRKIHKLWAYIGAFGGESYFSTESKSIPNSYFTSSGWCSGAGTPMFSNRVKFKGENKTIWAKRPLHNSVEENFGNSSHRPEFNYVTTERLEPAIEVNEQCKILESLESDVHETKWALRRILTVNWVECNHWALGKKCRSKLRAGDVTPCFCSDYQLSY